MSKKLVGVFAFGCLMVSVGLPAQAGDDKGKNGGTYIALGDSVPFGFTFAAFPPAQLSRYVGYPEMVSGVLHNNLVNASCPGETSGSLNYVTSADLGCNHSSPFFGGAAWKGTFPMFVQYSAGESQLQFALNQLKKNNSTHLVTIQVGGNDLGLLQIGCNFDVACEMAGITGTATTLQMNLRNTITQIRDTGYAGPIVVVNYYAFNYADTLQVGAFTLLNQAIALAAAGQATVADAFSAFWVASTGAGGNTCKAGLRVALGGPDFVNPSTGDNCDSHPTTLGHALISGTVLFEVGKK